MSRLNRFAPPRGDQSTEKLMSKLSILIALRHGDTHAQTISPLLDALQPTGAVLVSNVEETLPPHADGIVVVDGWGHTSLVRCAERCQRHFGSPVLLAILNESSCGIAEVLDSGFDYCARWPIPPVEVAAAMRALLRRAGKHKETPEIELDPLNLRVRCREVEATLTRGQFGVLSELFQQASRWVTSRQLLAVTSGTRPHDTTQIRNHILALRRKLGPEAWRIRWHRSLGYSFDVSQPTAAARRARSRAGKKE